jgi:mannose-6-phosphate isomerase-like protein (cupin superfamily)
MGDIIVLKATPRTGTQGGEMLTATLPPGFSTGLHVHKRADEFFFVVAGEGSVILGVKELEIGPGDVVFVARGESRGVGA